MAFIRKTAAPGLLAAAGFLASACSIGPQGFGASDLSSVPEDSSTAVTRGGLDGPNQGGSNLSGANLSGLNLSGLNMAGPNLGGGNLSGLNLGGGNLSGLNLSGTNMAGANLGGENLASSNLSGLNLSGLNLSGLNLSGLNLSATNLSGNNLATTNLSGGNLSTTNLSGLNLSAPNIAVNIHGQAANGLLPSGEDLWTNTDGRCVVLGIGSTAFARLVAQNNGSRMSAALKELPWGFSSTANGQLELVAWEALVWGSTSYCSFLLVAPPNSTFAGVAGFIKAVWRWNAAPGSTMDIGAIGGGQPIASYPGMMNASALVLNGTIGEKAFVAGESAFISATTNNEPVNVDFASWVRKRDNTGKILGTVSGAPRYGDAVFMALEAADGSILINLSHLGEINTVPSSYAKILQKNVVAQAGYSQAPWPRRCSGALALNSPSLIDAKCDAYLTRLPLASRTYFYSFADLEPASAVPPYTTAMYAENATPKASPAYVVTNSSDNLTYPVISETYVHLNDGPHSNVEWLNRSALPNGKLCKSVSGGGPTKTLCVVSGSGNQPLWIWSLFGWSQTLGRSGVSVVPTDGDTDANLLTSNGEVHRFVSATQSWVQIASSNSFKAIGGGKRGIVLGIANGAGDRQIKSYSGSGKTWNNLGTLTGVKATVDSDGKVYFAKANGDVFQVAFGSTTARLVAPGPCKEIAAGGGALYCTDAVNAVRRLNKVTFAWESTGKSATAISVDDLGNLSLVDAGGNLVNEL